MSESVKKPKYSVVIPVFNSETIVAKTIERTVKFFTDQQLEYEILLINDGSQDSSWQVINKAAQSYPNVVAIDLLRNYGQHNANLCGFQHATGDWVVTMDDDLQNPPEEIIHLIEKAKEGYHLVIGKFRQKQHAVYRRLGSVLIGLINRKIFFTPPDIVLSNFRLIERSIVNRVCSYKTGYPYVPGLVLLFSSNVANVEVDHQPRVGSKSNYNIRRILRLVATILFNYSSYPLRLVSTMGLVFAFLSFSLGGFYLLNAIFSGTSSPGWPTLVVLLSVFSSIIMVMLSMIGEYLVRLINQVSYEKSYIVKEVVGAGES